MGLLELEPCLPQQGLVSGSVLRRFWSKWFYQREPQHRVIYSVSLSLTCSHEGSECDYGRWKRQSRKHP